MERVCVCVWLKVLINVVAFIKAAVLINAPPYH